MGTFYISWFPLSLPYMGNGKQKQNNKMVKKYGSNRVHSGTRFSLLTMGVYLGSLLCYINLGSIKIHEDAVDEPTKLSFVNYYLSKILDKSHNRRGGLGTYSRHVEQLVSISFRISSLIKKFA